MALTKQDSAVEGTTGAMQAAEHKNSKIQKLKDL